MSAYHWSLDINPEDIEWRDSDWMPFPEAPGLYVRVGKIESKSSPEGRRLTFFKSDVDTDGMIRVPSHNFDGSIGTTFRIHVNHGKNLPFGNGEGARKMIQSYVNGTMNHNLISFMGGPAYKASEIIPITEQEWNQYKLIARSDPWLGRFVAPSRMYEPSEPNFDVNSYADPEAAARIPEASKNAWQQYQKFLAQREELGPLLDKTTEKQAIRNQAPYNQPAGPTQPTESATAQPNQSTNLDEGRQLSGSRGTGDQVFTGELINDIPDWAHPYFSSMPRSWMLSFDPDKPVRWSEPAEWGASTSFTMTPRDLMRALNAPPPEAGPGSPGARVTGEPSPVAEIMDEESEGGASSVNETPDEQIPSQATSGSASAGDWYDDWTPVEQWPGISKRRKYVEVGGELRLRGYYKSEMRPDGTMILPSKYDWHQHHPGQDGRRPLPDGVNPNQNWYFEVPAQAILDMPNDRGNERAKDTIKNWLNGEANRNIYHTPIHDDISKAINEGSFLSNTPGGPDSAISVKHEEFREFSTIARYHPLVGYYIPSRSHFASGDSYQGQDAQLRRFDEFIAYREELANSDGPSADTEIIGEGEGEGGTETQEDDNGDISPGRTLPEDDPNNISVGNISDVYNPDRHTDRSSGAQPGDSDFMSSRTQVHMRVANIRANRGISQNQADVEEWVDRIMDGTHAIGDARTAINNLANEYEKIYAAQNQEDKAPSAPTPPPPSAPTPPSTPEPAPEPPVSHPKYDPTRHIDHSIGDQPGDANFTTRTQVRTRVRQIRENRGLDPYPESDDIWVERIVDNKSHSIGDARTALQDRAMEYKSELEQMQSEQRRRSAYHQPNDQNTSFTPGTIQTSQENTQHDARSWVGGGNITKSTLSGNDAAASATPYVKPTETKPPRII